jgi:hypothetical protein
MKKAILLTIGLAFLFSGTALAGKPVDIIELSNGFPSGHHFNLNIHGKSLNYQCNICVPDPNSDPPVECNVVNIPEYTEESGVENTITYVSGKKVKIDVLTVFDSCSEYYDSSPAEVWLPNEAEGYWVFARALGKPGKKDESVRRIILANNSLEAYSLSGDVSNPDDVNDQFLQDLALGLILKNGTYKMANTGDDLLIRFDPEPEGKGNGKTLGKDITDMFLWTGFAFDPVLDLNEDGTVDELDVEYACWSPYDSNNDGIIDQIDLDALGDANGDGSVDRLDLVFVAPCDYDLNGTGIIDVWDGVFEPCEEGVSPDSEFETWLCVNKLDALGNILWEYYDEKWVFTIADLVYHNQVVTNEGIKNLQIRFYPVATTTFEQAPDPE